MGFRQGAFAKIWGVEPVSDTVTKCRLSISRKNKQTGQYEQDFSGFVKFVGTAVAKRAANLKEGDRIKLGDVDVTTTYNAEKKITYTNFTAFGFEAESNQRTATTPTFNTEPQPEVDSGELDDRLPF